MNPPPTPPVTDHLAWTTICRYDQLLPERGVAALIGDTQVAIFRTFDGTLFAIDNQDPFTGSFVLSRGIVGTRGDVPTVASPLHKQIYELTTGRCPDDPELWVTVFPVTVRDGVVAVALP